MSSIASHSVNEFPLPSKYLFAPAVKGTFISASAAVVIVGTSPNNGKGVVN